jgi:hypothetical protein
MAGIEPGDRPGPSAGRPARELERPPGERYADSSGSRSGLEAQPASSTRASGLVGPVARASLAATIGTLVLYALGALLSSSAGLVFVAGLTGAVVGLLLARAAKPGRGERPAFTTRQATWAAVGLTLLGVVVAAAGTWLHALGEGGALGPVDYLLETFGVVVPAELVIGAIGAAWGAGAGPVER